MCQNTFIYFFLVAFSSTFHSVSDNYFLLGLDISGTLLYILLSPVAILHLRLNFLRIVLLYYTTNPIGLKSKKVSALICRTSSQAGIAI